MGLVLETVGAIMGIAVGALALLAILWRMMHRIDLILESSQSAQEAKDIAASVETKLDDLKVQVAHLSTETTETFRTRTEDFTRLAHEASTRLRDLERENSRLKSIVAREAGRMDAHAIEDDRRFDRIEATLSDIKSQLAHLTGQAAAGTAPSSTTPPV